jgi:heme exporter protein A
LSALLRFEQVACLRGGRLLFRGLDLAIAPGEALVVAGPNGVGKSSLIRLAAGLLRPFSGTVTRGGEAALADEAVALDNRLTLGRALAFWAGLDGGAAETGMAAMGLTHLADVPVRMLSTGQRKRATLARVIAGDAPLWLLDEPANGLDSESSAMLTQAVAAHRQRGGGVLAASHMPLGFEDAATLRIEGIEP